MSEQQAENYKCIVAVKVRGHISARREAIETLRILRLLNTNNAIIIDNRPSYLGMLQRVQSYVTWGEASKESIELMLKHRGKLVGGKKLNDETVKQLGYESLKDLSGDIVNGKVEQWKLDMRPVFKLHPPKKGYKGKIKKSFRSGGESGNRGSEINELIKRML